MTRKRLSPPAWADGGGAFTGAVDAKNSAFKAVVGGGSAS